MTRSKAKPQSPPVAPHNLNLAPALARLETYAHAPWVIGAMSHQGHGHAQDGTPNQDAFAISRIDDATVMVVADGVSTTACGHAGSNLAVTLVSSHVQTLIGAGQKLGEHLITQAIVRARMEMMDTARAHGFLLKELATTLLVAIISDRSVTVAKCGDGAIVAVERSRDKDRLISLLDCPHTGSGVVDFTHADWKSHLRVRHFSDRRGAPIDTIALATDGAVPYFFKADASGTQTASQTPSYIGAELDRQLAARGPRNLFAYFAQLAFLKGHIDEPDDKTMIVATRYQGAK